MTENDSAYPYNPEIYNEQRGLTKLELISAMCLQGLLGNKEFSESSPTSLASYSTIFTKELLKQLEAENDN